MHTRKTFTPLSWYFFSFLLCFGISSIHVVQESNANTEQRAIEIETKENLWEFLYKMFSCYSSLLLFFFLFVALASSRTCAYGKSGSNDLGAKRKREKVCAPRHRESARAEGSQNALCDGKDSHK